MDKNERMQRSERARNRRHENLPLPREACQLTLQNTFFFHFSIPLPNFKFKHEQPLHLPNKVV